MANLLVHIKKFQFILKLVVAISLIIFLLSRIGVIEIKNIVLKLGFFPFLVVIFLILLTHFISTINMFLLLKGLKKEVNFKSLFKYIILSYSFGLITPAKLGEFSLAILLKKENVPIVKGLSLSIIDKIITLFTLCLLSSFGIFLFLSKQIAVYFILTICIVILFSIFIFRLKKLRFLIKRCIPKKYFMIIADLPLIVIFFVKHRSLILLFNFLLTIFKWLVGSYMAFFLFQSLGIDINFLFVFIIVSMVILLSLIPISLSGLGVQETSAAYFFLIFLTIPFEITAAIFIYTTVVNYTLSAFMVLLFSMKK